MRASADPEAVQERDRLPTNARIDALRIEPDERLERPAVIAEGDVVARAGAPVVGEAAVLEPERARTRRIVVEVRVGRVTRPLRRFDDLDGCSVSPFIPGEETPLANAPTADIDLTLNCMAALRLMRTHWIIPAVSALNLAEPGIGYRRGRPRLTGVGRPNDHVVRLIGAILPRSIFVLFF